MARLRPFSTALDGQTVTLALIQDGVTAGPLTVQSWGRPAASGGSAVPDTPGVSATVVQTREPTNTAPECVHFRIEGWTGFDTEAGPVPGYDARHHLIEYYWDFGDPGSTFTAPEHLLPEHRNANIGYGPVAAHVYSKPGTYDGSVLLIELATGKSVTVPFSVTVADPDVLFAGAQTSYVDPDGDYADAPAGARTYTSLVSAMTATSGRGPTRILLRRGKTYVERYEQLRSSLSSMLVQATGTGAPPIWRADATAGSLLRIVHDYGGKFFTLDGIECAGDWDATTETGDLKGGIACESRTHFLATRCRFDGVGTAMSSIQTPGGELTGADQCFAMHDTVIASWQDYGVWASHAHTYAFLGTRIAQEVQAHSGGDKFKGFNQHGCLRFQPNNQPEVPIRAVVHGCDLFSRTGWFPNYAPHLGLRTQQPCIRWNMGQMPNSFLNVQASAFEGGFPLIATGRMNGTLDVVTNSVLIERSVLVGSHMSYAIISSHSTGGTARNNLMIHPDAPRLMGIYQPERFVEVDHQSSGPGAPYPDAYRAPVIVAGNTCISHMRAANWPGTPRTAPVFEARGSQSGSITATFIVEDNVHHEPNAQAPRTGFAPLDQTPLWAPREVGPIIGTQHYEVTLPARLWPGDPEVVVPWPAGQTAADFWQGGGDQSSMNGLTDHVAVRHLPEGIGLENNGDPSNAKHRRDQGASVKLLLDRRLDPIRMPEYATPAGTVSAGGPLADSAAIGAATSDHLPRDDLRGRVRPVHPSVGALEVA